MNRRLTTWVHGLLDEWSGADARDAARRFLHEQRLTIEEIQEMVEDHVTDCIRRILRKRDDNGMPLFANLVTTDGEGTLTQQYRRRDMLQISDYGQVVRYHTKQAVAHSKMARAFTQEAKERFGVQLALPDFIAQMPELPDADDTTLDGLVSEDGQDATGYVPPNDSTTNWDQDYQ